MLCMAARKWRVSGSAGAPGVPGQKAHTPLQLPRSVGFGEGNLCERGLLLCNVSHAAQQPSDLGACQCEPEFQAKVSGL